MAVCQRFLNRNTLEMGSNRWPEAWSCVNDEIFYSPLGPILLMWINFNPASISNPISSKVQDEITLPFSKMKFGNG